MTTAYISHPLFLKHRGPPGHPECAERLEAITHQLKADGVFDMLEHHTAPRAARADIERVHTQRLISELDHTAPTSGLSSIDPDTYMNAHSLEAAWHAAGAAVLATRLVSERSVRNAFCAVRPPGHHAERDRAMGFCLLNSVAVAAAYALEDIGLDRVAILDFDVHHGNGTENICSPNERVLLCSTFQHPFYPYDGAETEQSNIVNVPLPSGTGSEAFRDAVLREWIPALNDFKPEMIFISAGFDAHAEDRLANFSLCDDDYQWVTQTIMDVADEHADGEIVSCLEGGYALDALGRCVSLHVRTLRGVDGG